MCPGPRSRRKKRRTGGRVNSLARFTGPVPSRFHILMRYSMWGFNRKMSEAKKRGRKPLFGKAMTVLERQHRFRAARSKRAREAAPDQFPGIMTGEEMFVALGMIDQPTFSAEDLAALRAMPGGSEGPEGDDDQPAIDPETGEPIYPGDSP
jgi:hypothetical protein